MLILVQKKSIYHLNIKILQVLFFCFDGEEYLKNGNMKYWIFGHNHNVIEYEEFNVKCICNPLGYHKESGNGQWTKIKQIEV